MYIMVVRGKLKIPSFGITVRRHSADLVMRNIYPRDENFNPHLTTIKYFYNLTYNGPFFGPAFHSAK